MGGGLAGLLLRAGLATGCGAIAGQSHAPWPATGEAPVVPDIERTAFQVAGAAGMLEMPPGAAGRPAAPR